jgi:hypothetical protein
MKKLFIAAIIAAAFLTSCTKDSNALAPNQSRVYLRVNEVAADGTITSQTQIISVITTN